MADLRSERGECPINAGVIGARSKRRDGWEVGKAPRARLLPASPAFAARESPAAACPGERDRSSNGLGRGHLSRAPVWTGASEVRRQRGCARRQRRPLKAVARGRRPNRYPPRSSLAKVPIPSRERSIPKVRSPLSEVMKGTFRRCSPPILTREGCSPWL